MVPPTERDPASSPTRLLEQTIGPEWFDRRKFHNPELCCVVDLKQFQKRRSV